MRLSLAVLLVVALAAAGCEQRTTVSGDLRDAGRSLGHGTAGLAHNQDIGEAQADLRQAGRDASHDLRRAEAEARTAASRITADTRRAIHDLTHHNAPDRAND